MPTGRRLGAYQVQARIGVGGMGEVYRARDTKLGRDVAIKILPRALHQRSRSAGAVRTRGAGTRVTQSSTYRRDLRIGRADGVRALVLELVNGETLADRIARGPSRSTKLCSLRDR